MGISGLTVLLVGKGARGAPVLEKHLLKRGCDIFFAASKKEASELLQRRRFDVVLSEFILTDGTAYQLMTPLLGTDTTMFVSNAVEDGCWWMTAVLKGQDYSHEAGMRPTEFRIRLDEILYDKSFRSTGHHTERLAGRREMMPSGAAVSVEKQARASRPARPPGANGHAEL
jgi:DNA-binding NtrC family response regulator